MGDTWGIALLLNNMADLALASGQLDDAKTFIGESLRLRRELGDASGMSNALCTMGLIARARGEIQEAGRHHAASLKKALEVGSQGLMVSNIEGVAAVACSEGRLLESARLMGAVETQTARLRERASPLNQARFESVRDELESPCRTSPDFETLESAWAVGRTISLDRAVTEALALVGEESTDQMARVS